jgi:coenzyme F420-reducing hydrogenase beta subunit
MIKIKDKQNCSGCGACMVSCPQKCIQMISDQEGFVYPVVDEKSCIDCDVCVKACPIINLKSNNNTPISYAVINNSDKVRQESSSGGVFSIIANAVIQKGGVVFGASFDEKFSVKHICVDRTEELYKLRGSKYVQSNLNDTYQQARSFLKEGRLVYFTGTPCQIEGLYAFLKYDYENLITSDLICHGVPSPKVWELYLKHLEDKASSNVRVVSFRDKTYGWENYSIKFEFLNNIQILRTHSEDEYMKAFLCDLSLRPSCYSCAFKGVNRRSDFTLADFWGINNLMPQMNDKRGTTLLLVNTGKGRDIFEQIKNEITFEKVESAEAIKYNSAAIQSVQKPKKRDEFMSKINSKNFKKVVDKYSKKSVYNRLKSKIYSVYKRVFKN